MLQEGAIDGVINGVAATNGKGDSLTNGTQVGMSCMHMCVCYEYVDELPFLVVFAHFYHLLRFVSCMKTLDFLA